MVFGLVFQGALVEEEDQLEQKHWELFLYIANPYRQNHAPTTFRLLTIISSKKQIQACGRYAYFEGTGKEMWQASWRCVKLHTLEWRVAWEFDPSAICQEN